MRLTELELRSGIWCCHTELDERVMCLCWCCVCLRLRTSTGQRTTTTPSIMALFQMVRSQHYYTDSFLSHYGLWEMNWPAWISMTKVKYISLILHVYTSLLFDFICQDFRGAPAVQPIKQKEPGTKMGKDWASGMCSLIRRERRFWMILETLHVRDTIESRWPCWYLTQHWLSKVPAEMQQHF